jgi:hypothetical protein
LEVQVSDMDQVVLALSFAVGYIIGSLDSIRKTLKMPEGSTSFVSEIINESKQKSKKKITIDETKYITDVSTDGIESKFNELGVISQSKDDISSAANKLAQLKKLKDS